MDMRTKFASAMRELKLRGFVGAGIRKGNWFFRGALPSPRGELRILLTIYDWDFLEYPIIHVVGGLEKFPALRPHLDKDGGLCYFSRRAVVLNRDDPATALAQCLEQAEAVLGKLLGDQDYVATDIQNEFLVHWARQEPIAREFHLGTVRKDAVVAPMHFGEDSRAIIADDFSQAQTLAKTLGWAPLTESANRAWLFRTSKVPPIPDRFPGTVKELFDWLRKWDTRLYNKTQHLLVTEAAYEYVMLAIAVHMPVGWIGFRFQPHEPQASSAMGKTPTVTTAKQRKQYLHGRGGNTRIDRLRLIDVSPEFVHSRNLTFPDLTNKRITVIGCGAIGSQIAAGLVRLGAGQGPSGLLRLIDEEYLMPENLGRHLLGYNRLGEDKSEALRKELLVQFPFCRIEAVRGSVQTDKSVFFADLVIDATGDESVSEYLNGTWLGRGRPCPLLFTWIRGNGECVQSLLIDSATYACFRCLRLNNPAVHREERFPILKRLPDRKNLGCHAFTPYAVSAPLHAAALALDVVCDWLQGRASPRFRTRSRENADVLPVVNGDPLPLQDCPACRPK